MEICGKFVCMILDDSINEDLVLLIDLFDKDLF